MKVLGVSQFVSERMKVRPVTNAELDQIQQEMNSDKYELTDETTSYKGHVLYRIKALKNIPSMKVKKGDLGGFVESYDNLDQKGNCWIADEAKVYRSAKVYGDAKVFDNAEVKSYATVSDNAKIYGDTLVFGNVTVYGDALVYGNACVYDNAKVYGTAKVYDNAIVNGYAKVYDNAKVYGSAHVYDCAYVYGNAEVCGYVEVNYDVNKGKIDK